MFINDLFLFVNELKAANFVDNNTIYASYKISQNLQKKDISNLKSGSEAVILY